MHALRNLNLTDAQKQQIAGFVKNARLATRNAQRQLRQHIEGVLTDAQRAQLRANLAHGRPAGAPSPKAAQ